jgi:phosphatidate cytidylyltransferase
VTAAERLFGWEHAFDRPLTAWMCGGIAALLVVAPVIVMVFARLGRIGPEQRAELFLRCRTWWLLAALIVLPILLGAAWTIGATALLALLCFREYARATGLFRERLVSAAVIVGILLSMFAALDHWYGLFAASGPLAAAFIAAIAVVPDQPKGYIQRVGLAGFALALFAGGLGHFAFIANDADYRPILLWLLISIELNDVFAYTSGKLFGRRKLCPRTSPNKTVAGAVGSLVGTTAVAAGIGSVVFAGTPVAEPLPLVAIGALISVSGTLGDLLVSSVKRDVGIKDTGSVLPGHGGLLDRFDSMLLTAPVVFHAVGYLRPGYGYGQAQRLITGD